MPLVDFVLSIRLTLSSSCVFTPRSKSAMALAQCLLLPTMDEGATLPRRLVNNLQYHERRSLDEMLEC